MLQVPSNIEYQTAAGLNCSGAPSTAFCHHACTPHAGVCYSSQIDASASREGLLPASPPARLGSAWLRFRTQRDASHSWIQFLEVLFQKLQPNRSLKRLLDSL